MTEQEFLDAISRSAGRLPRLAFADWLDERGDPRAAWVRHDAVWPFMAPDAGDPSPRMARVAFWRSQWEEIAGLAEELGPVGFYSFLAAYSEHARYEWGRRVEREESGWPRTKSADEAVAALAPWLARHCRPAWKPVVVVDDGPLTASKFCGTPWIGKDHVWPDCRDCKSPLLLFVQLNLKDLPAELGERFGGGLLQLFYCPRRCFGGSEPFEDSVSCVRLVPSDAGAGSASGPRVGPHFPARRVVSWRRFFDFPSPAEHHNLGLCSEHDSVTGGERLASPEFGVAIDYQDEGSLWDEIAPCADGDKLGGWPNWVQDPRYPNCPRCGRRMEFIFQLDSEDNVPFMFGDCGVGHLTQCPEHKDVVGFGWDGS